MDVEGTAAGGVNSAQVDVVDRHAIDLEIIECDAEAMIGDDAVARVDIRAVSNDAAGKPRIVAINRQILNGNVACGDQKYTCGPGR